MENEKFQDLVLEQLARLTQEITEIKQGQRELTTKVDGLDAQISKLETKIENEVIDKIKALYDAREVQSDVNERIISTLGRIETKMDVLQMETASYSPSKK